MRTVIHYTDTVAYGGAEKMLLSLAAELDRRGWRSVLVHHPGPAELEELLAEAARLGIETVAVPRVDRRSGLADMPSFVRAIRALRAEVFHAHLAWPLRCTAGLAAATLAGVPLRVASQQLFAEHRSRTRLRRQRWVSRLVHEYIAVSAAMAVRLEPTLARGSRVRVINNAVDLDRFEVSRGTGRAGDVERRPGRPIVLTLARLDPQKGLEHLIAAATRVADADFLIAGTGMERERLHSEAARLGVEDRIRFLGHRSDVPALFASCDLFVLPSLFEGLPVSVLEAMAAGKPVVATAIEGTDEAVVDGVTGLLVPPADPHALADAIRRVLTDDALARRFGEAGRARVAERFSVGSMAASVEKLYEERLAGKRWRSQRNGTGGWLRGQ